ncbi:MAG: imidazole glycerol phosphate synthase subunit HisH [Desulfovibrio sp.]|jgi:glutamine amidotransferase|nr:imidazole glycerol phosphate synthase subunit HisH [Desulfovibrio sp.]
MLAILEYGSGNQTSVRRALEHLGVPCVVTADPALAAGADGVVFPGVGAAGQAMRALSATGLDGAIRRAVDRGQPLLGICLGCQILLQSSEENDTETLGVVPGTCRRFADGMIQEDGTPAPVPHMGWNGLQRVGEMRLLAGVHPAAEFYFVHSYHVDPAPEFVLTTTEYGGRFCSSFGRDGLWAVQFHPEKSGEPGLALLRNFADYCREAAHAE